MRTQRIERTLVDGLHIHNLEPLVKQLNILRRKYMQFFI